MYNCAVHDWVKKREVIGLGQGPGPRPGQAGPGPTGQASVCVGPAKVLAPRISARLSPGGPRRSGGAPIRDASRRQAVRLPD